jgi:superfamily I DNA and RNA helicase
MPRFKIGDTVFVEGRRATVVWLSENANEIEAMDEYILEFDDKQRRFVISSTLTAEKAPPGHNREHDTDRCHGQTY